MENRKNGKLWPAGGEEYTRGYCLELQRGQVNVSKRNDNGLLKNVRIHH